MKAKRLTVFALATVMTVSNIMTALAVEPDTTEGGGNNSKVILKVIDDIGGGGDTPTPDPNPKPETFSVTVPATINISMGLSGKITVPSNLEIINNNDSGIKLTNVDVQVVGDWTAVDFDITEAPVAEEISGDNTKTISFAFRGDKMNSQGLVDVTPESWNFAPNDGLPLNTKVRIPKQSTVTEIDIANINWEFDWSDSDVSSDPSIGADIDIPTEETVTVTFIEPEGVTIKGSKTLELKVGDKLTFPDIELNGIRYEVENWIDNDTKEVLSSDYVVTKNTNVSLTLKEKEANPKNWFTASGNTLTGLSDEYLNMVDAPTDLVIPNNIGGSKITAIGANAFANKDLITSIIVPNTVTSIAADAFSSMDANLKVDLSYVSIYPDDASYIAGAPWGATLSNIILSSERKDWDTDSVTGVEAKNRGISYRVVGNTCKVAITDSIENIVVPSSIDGRMVTELLSRSNLSTIPSLKSITMPETITTIGDSTFKNCKNLNNVVLPKSVTKIDAFAFQDCSNLSSIEILGNVQNIGTNAFSGSIIDELRLPTSIIVGDMGFIFGSYVGYVIYDGDINLARHGAVKIWKSSDNIIPWDSDPVTSEELPVRGLSFNESTRSITYSGNLPADGVIKIPSSVDGKRVVSVGDNFKNNANIKEVHYPSAMNTGSQVFSGCTGITKVILPKCGNISYKSFYGCLNLTSIDIPNEIDSIAGEAFTNTGITSLNVPNSVSRLYNNAFLNIQKVKYSGTAEGSPWGAKEILPNN